MQSVLEWQRDKVDWCGKNANFSTLTSFEGPKKLNVVNKPFHPSTNIEILVKIGPLHFELPGLDRNSAWIHTAKKVKNRKILNKKHWQNI